VPSDYIRIIIDDHKKAVAILEDVLS